MDKRVTLTAKERKLFPIHPPLYHVGLELEGAQMTILALRKVLHGATEDFTFESSHVHTMLEAMVERAAREIELTVTMLDAASQIEKRAAK